MFIAAALQSAGIAGIAAAVLAILPVPRLTRMRHEKAPADTVPAAFCPPRPASSGPAALLAENTFFGLLWIPGVLPV
ncbi:hypothetical protein AB5J52_29215 [Streptomyces sp. R39]|uniref:MFS transporter n=1 Tax=Streptomyces sp. R39 TaxID=3238631 RepID=A0AB39QYX7_9ACTN